MDEASRDTSPVAVVEANGGTQGPLMPFGQPSLALGGPPPRAERPPDPQDVLDGKDHLRR